MFSDNLPGEMIVHCNQIKSYPAVNGINGGNFNSEENLRWMSKKITNKPYIVGQTDEDVMSSFNYIGRDTLNGNNNILMNGGLISLDGYLFKVFSNDDPDYDTDVSDSLIVMNARPTEDFISGLISYTTNNAIKTEQRYFLRGENNPDSDYAIEDVVAAWENSYANKSCIGYLGISYTGTYLNALTVQSGLVKFGNRSIRIATSTIPVSLDMTCDEILAIPKVGFTDGKDYAMVINSSQILIFYALYFKDIKTFNTSTRDYDTYTAIAFTDIFGIDYEYRANRVTTKSYPWTQNNYTDMDNNLPLADFSGVCDKTTIPTHIYNFEYLYDGNSERFSRYDAQSGSINESNLIVSSNFSNVLSEIFDKKTLGTDLKDNIPGTVTSYSIDNNISYYCIKGINSADLLKVTDSNGIQHDIPVAFMTSTGQLCTEGVIGASEDENYPVESYIHFFKRMYITATGSTTPITQLTVAEMCSVNNSTTSDLYNTYLAKPVFAYIHLCYCSLLDNTIFTSSTSNADSMKSSGCGELLSAAGATSDDYFAYLDYNSTQYSILNGELTPISGGVDVQLKYNKDKTSDAKKLSEYLRTSLYYDITSEEDPSMTMFLKVPITGNNQSAQMCTMIQDPINLMKHTTTSSGVLHNIQAYKITQFIQDDIITISMNPITKKMYPGGSGNGVIYSMNIDEDLLPHFGDMLTTGSGKEICIYFSLPSVEKDISIKNGLSLCAYVNEWRIHVPQSAEAVKDAYNYLAGKDFNDTSIYKGLKIGCYLGDDRDTVGFLFNQTCDTAMTNENNGEIFTLINDTTSYNSKRRRECFLPVEKVYGDGFKTIQEMIKEGSEFDPSALDELNAAVGIPYNDDDSLSERVTELERIIEIPYTDENSVSDRLTAIEAAIGMPYTNSVNISTRLDSIEQSLRECMRLFCAIKIEPDGSDPTGLPQANTPNLLNIHNDVSSSQPGILPAHTEWEIAIHVVSSLDYTSFSGWDTSISLRVYNVPQDTTYERTQKCYYRTYEGPDTGFTAGILYISIVNDGDTAVDLNSYILQVTARDKWIPPIGTTIFGEINQRYISLAPQE